MMEPIYDKGVFLTVFEVIRTEGKARRGVFTCAHGTVQTPVFMNVGTQGAIKGGVSALDLKEIGCQVELSNTYHLHLRPGDQIVRQMGGLHKFMRWDGPILTDSGGFQVFSLSGLRKIKEEGVTFASHIDGRRIFMGPEESMQIQSNLGSDIAMAFDECVENPATYEYAKASCERTLRWLERCKAEHDRLNALPDAINPSQMLFGINQGATFEELRVWHMKEISKIDCEGYAIGGLAVGEPTQVMYDIIDAVEPHMPVDKPRYLMGVGTPSNIIEAVARGFAGAKPELADPYVERYFAEADWIWTNRTFHMAEALLEGLWPVYADPAKLVEQGDAWLEAHTDADNAFRRIVIGNLEIARRALKVRDYNAALQ